MYTTMMHKRLTTFVAILWGIAIILFFRELYVYAFVEAMGIPKALEMFGTELQKAIMGFGVFTPVLFILLYSIRPLVLFPASIMTITSVFLFGPYGGFAVSYVGELCSAVVAFFVGKYFGEELGLTKRVASTKIGSYFQGNPFTSVLVLRLVPLFPFDFVNYASGVAKLPTSAYLYGTALGVLPGLAMYIFLGFSLMHTEYLLLALCLFGVLIGVSRYFKPRLSQGKQ
ncbi:MAG: TVP38/TMEM64 family protein [Polynucleobacter sp.]|nr:MAG: TVP38/TMEM64 family protein [Polynucleobacter sp.]